MTLSPFRNTALLYGRCWRRYVPAARLAGPGGTSLYQGTLPPRNSKPQVTGHIFTPTTSDGPRPRPSRPPRPNHRPRSPVVPSGPTTTPARGGGRERPERPAGGPR